MASELMPPLCKGWCDPQRIKIYMIASGNHSSAQWQGGLGSRQLRDRYVGRSGTTPIGLHSRHSIIGTIQCGEVRLRLLPKGGIVFSFSEDGVLPDPCGGPSFLVSARKEAKKPTGEALNVALPRAKAALPGLLPARTWQQGKSFRTGFDT